jgi:hypothetical protein
MMVRSGAGRAKRNAADESAPAGASSGQMISLEVNAAYNRDALPMPKPNGANGRRVLNLEMLINHPHYWEWLNERETAEVLMELYVARTRRTQ